MKQQDRTEGGANGVEEHSIKNMANDKTINDLVVHQLEGGGDEWGLSW